MYIKKLTLVLLLADIPLSLMDMLLRLPAKLGVNMSPGVPVELVIVLLGPTVVKYKAINLLRILKLFSMYDFEQLFNKGAIK